MRLRVDFPMRYSNDNYCCNSPDARKRKVTTSLSPADIDLYLLCGTVFCQPKQMIESFRSYPNVPVDEI